MWILNSVAGKNQLGRIVILGNAVKLFIVTVFFKVLLDFTSTPTVFFLVLEVQVMFNFFIDNNLNLLRTFILKLGIPKACQRRN